MPVTTVSADQVVYVNGHPTITQNSNTTNGNPHSSARYNNNNHRYRHNRYRCRAQQLTPRLDLVKPGSSVALGCEGVKLIGEEFEGWRSHGVGRCSIVNIHGEVVYDTFVYYPEGVNHRPSPQWIKLGVKYKDILPENGAQPHVEVLANAKAIFDKSGTVVAHAATNDQRFLHPIDFSKYKVRDTQTFAEYRKAVRRRSAAALSILASSVLGRNIQTEEHSSVEDAQATMDLFLLHHKKYEAGCDFTGDLPLLRKRSLRSDPASPLLPQLRSFQPKTGSWLQALWLPCQTSGAWRKAVSSTYL